MAQKDFLINSKNVELLESLSNEQLKDVVVKTMEDEIVTKFKSTLLHLVVRRRGFDDITDEKSLENFWNHKVDELAENEDVFNLSIATKESQ